MKKIAVLTSGGDAPGMNAAIRAVVCAAAHEGIEVVGIKRGYAGTLEPEGNIIPLTVEGTNESIYRGGTFLLSARCKEFVNPEVQKIGAENLRKLGVDSLVAIGGDGTFHGALALSRLGISVIGIPGTIDNDLPYTDYTIGFDTAVTTACACTSQIHETCMSHERGALIVVMGRDCGDIATYTALAVGAESVIVPERKWSILDIAERIKRGKKAGIYSPVIIMAEGAMVSLTDDIAKLGAEHPEFGLSADEIPSPSKIATILEKLSGVEMRANVLGHVQRGGNPSVNDRVLASRLGNYAVQLLKQGVSDVAVGTRAGSMINVPIQDTFGTHRAASEELLDVQLNLSI